MTTRLTKTQQAAFLELIQNRFEKNNHRHEGISWKEVLNRLEKVPEKIQSLYLMEQTNGEPDVIGRDKKTGELIFVDCASESPIGHRSLCYDRAALDARKENKPEGNVMDVAASMGIEVLSEDDYRWLQKLGKFDLKTSSWINTPKAIRDLGGALFCDRRYETVFVYHNGAQSYYASRGFRGMLRV